MTTRERVDARIDYAVDHDEEDAIQVFSELVRFLADQIDGLVDRIEHLTDDIDALHRTNAT